MILKFSKATNDRDALKMSAYALLAACVLLTLTSRAALADAPVIVRASPGGR